MIRRGWSRVLAVPAPFVVATVWLGLVGLFLLLGYEVVEDRRDGPDGVASRALNAAATPELTAVLRATTHLGSTSAAVLLCALAVA